MADVSTVNIDGKVYNIKDATSRQKILKLEESGIGGGMVAKQYEKTLLLDLWQEDTYNLSMPELKCGDGTISPLIAPADSLEHEEYDKITKAIATKDEGIVFTKASSETIEDDIDIIIIDFQYSTGGE